MKTSFKLQLDNQQHAGIATEELKRQPGLEPVTVRQVGDSVEFEFNNPLVVAVSGAVTLLSRGVSAIE